MSFLKSSRSATSKTAMSRLDSCKAQPEESRPATRCEGDEPGVEMRTIEGYLWVRVHSRRRRYCVLQGRTLHVYNSKDEATTPDGQLSPRSKKRIIVIGVKDAIDLDKQTRSQLLGGETNGGTMQNSLVISTLKSKLVGVEAETQTEKQRWLHAMSCLNFASAATERTLFLSMLQDKEGFDAHTAVTLLHKYRDNPTATELIIDRLAEYAEYHIDDVDFYIQQIMHLVINVEMAKTEKLVHLLLSICKSKAYVEHLGNCIHLALQLFWLLEAKIQDKDPKTYNMCAKLLMTIEANVVNQQFELPASGTTSSPDAVYKMLLRIPGMKERLSEMRKQSVPNNLQSVEARANQIISCPVQPTSLEAGGDSGDASSDLGPLTTTAMPTDEEATAQRELLMQWMEKERQKRYKYFHEQRDFVRALTDISEKMRLIEPPTERRKHLPAALESLIVPPMAYIPLGRVSDAFSRITRVLRDEGTVFSTHSRAPCLLCFEVIEDQVNAAGHRASFSRPTATASMSQRASMMTTGASASLMSTSVASFADEEVEISAYIMKFSFKGKYISVESDHTQDDDDDDDGGDVEQVAVMTKQDAAAEDATLQALERHLSIASSVEVVVPKATDGSSMSNDRSSEGGSTSIADVEEHHRLIRHRSRTLYEYSLSKLLSEGGTFGERWKAKKERIRASSPYGNLPGWNVISLISKSNDDIRQEVFAMQLITKFQEIFKDNNLPLWLRPYRIISTGKTCGLIETITDAQSLDALKKKPGYQSLRAHFEQTHGGGEVHSKMFKAAQRNFLHSLVAYSLVCYLLQIKDRHNGNIMLDTEGHVIHIDFGFMLGTAPGGHWSIETAPFKLTKEMVAVLGGAESKLFGEFLQLFARGLLAAQRSAEKIITLVEIMMRNSTFPCFLGRDVSKDLQKLRDRFLLNSSSEQTVKSVLKLVATSYKNKWTKRYDQFQKLTNGILP